MIGAGAGGLAASIDLARALKLPLGFWDPDAMNVSKHVPKALFLSYARRLLLAQGFDTVRFTHHVDEEPWQWRQDTRCNFSFFKDELLSLRRTIRRAGILEAPLRSVGALVRPRLPEVFLGCSGKYMHFNDFMDSAAYKRYPWDALIRE